MAKLYAKGKRVNILAWSQRDGLNYSVLTLYHKNSQKIHK
jgi:hypothetical protein